MSAQIKSFEEACEKLGISTALPDVSALPESEQKAVIANYKLTIIAKALNNGWVPDWSNYDEYKYYPYFDMKPGGFSFDDGDCRCTVSDVGSRLCFQSAELARYAGKTFTDLYKDYFVIE